jgi:hypothetical protein
MPRVETIALAMPATESAFLRLLCRFAAEKSDRRNEAQNAHKSHTAATLGSDFLIQEIYVNAYEEEPTLRGCLAHDSLQKRFTNLVRFTRLAWKRSTFEANGQER